MFAEALAHHVAQLATVDVSATTDPQTVLVPGALVQLTALNRDTFGGYVVDADVILVGPDVGWTEAVAVLEDLLGPALDVLDVAPDGRVTPATLTLPGQPPLPALVIPTRVSAC